MADQKPVIRIERIEAASPRPPQQAVLQEVRAAFVKVHAALLIDECLQQLQFRFRQDRSRCRSRCTHAFSRSPRPNFTCYLAAEAPRASALTALLSAFPISCS